VFDFKYDGVGFGHGGTGTLLVDGKAIESKKLQKTMPFVFLSRGSGAKHAAPKNY
jgi:arylsulfatase